MVAAGLSVGLLMEGDYLAAIGDAYRLLGDHEQAAANYAEALKFDKNLVRAHVGLATLRMSGEFYYL